MKKRIIACLLTGVFAGSMVAGCGAAGNDAQPADASLETAAETEAAAETAEGETAENADAPAEDGKVYKVGIVNYVDDASLNQIVENIEQELDAKGEELGVTFNYADYYDNAQADSTVLTQIITGMVSDEVDMIVAIATPVAITAQAQTEDNKIPVVFAAVTDPVGAGLVESMDMPGGNITGTSDALDTDAVMKLITAANPSISKLGLLYDTAQDSSEAAIEAAKKFCDENGIAYVEKTGSTTDDVMLAADSLIAEGVEAVFTPTDNTIMTAELSIYEKFAEAKIPHYCGADSFALNGAFLGYGVNYADLGKATGDLVSDILVNGSDPAQTPVVTFDNGIASINTETCAALGLDIEKIKTDFTPLSSGIVELTTAESFE